MTFGEAIMVGGLLLNLLATVGGIVSVLLRYERRLTTIETHILHLLPKRKTDLVTSE